jgi:hypothetical protein
MFGEFNFYRASQQPVLQLFNEVGSLSYGWRERARQVHDDDIPELRRRLIRPENAAVEGNKTVHALFTYVSKSIFLALGDDLHQRR